jgi:hypothetical protein
MSASHRGGPSAGPPDILAGGGWRSHKDRPADLTAARRRVAAIAAVAVVLVAGWTGRDYLTGSWRYWAEHRSPLTPGLMCPTYPNQALPGPGLLAAILDLGRGVPAAAVARQYGCEPASSIFGTQGRAPLPRGAGLK